MIFLENPNLASLLTCVPNTKDLSHFLQLLGHLDGDRFPLQLDFLLHKKSFILLPIIFSSQSLSIQRRARTGVKRFFQVFNHIYKYESPLPFRSWLSFGMAIGSSCAFNIIDFASNIHASLFPIRSQWEKVINMLK